ncbi:expansin EXLX1 family cellulose-binding protein [Ideonella sp. DXS29W]|uniref:Expansin EXLX1 family cellulose-binding protein n=1 Tax=Ideonella lacteola TaxID=2984193 RepID=A0ABU9C2Q1_9BURK
MNVKTIWSWGAVACLALMAGGVSAQQQATGGWKSVHEGEGTYYQYTEGGNCSFPPPTMLTAAMNNTDYDGAKACGGCIAVTNPANGKTVQVRIDDRCPECAPGDVDLDQEAFAQIAELWQGRIPITWKYIACTAPTLSLYFDPGSSQWWTSVQVRDHRYPLAKLAWRVTGSGKPFVAVPRELYNVFIPAGGMGTGPYDFKLTDVYGQVVKLTNVALAPGQVVKTTKQFPPLAGAKLMEGSLLGQALAEQTPLTDDSE